MVLCTVWSLFGTPSRVAVCFILPSSLPSFICLAVLVDVCALVVISDQICCSCFLVPFDQLFQIFSNCLHLCLFILSFSVIVRYSNTCLLLSFLDGLLFFFPLV